MAEILPHCFALHDKVQLTEPVDVGALIRDESASAAAGRPIFRDRTHVMVSGTFYVVQQRRDCDGTPLYVLCPYNDLDFESLSFNLFNISEEQIEPAEPIPQPDWSANWMLYRRE